MEDKEKTTVEENTEVSKEPVVVEKKPRTYGLKALVLVAFIAFAATILGAAL